MIFISLYIVISLLAIGHPHCLIEPDLNGKVVIKNQDVEDMAFFNCQKLKSLVLENVTRVGQRAFYESINLKSISFSNNLKIIGDEAFHRCASLNF